MSFPIRLAAFVSVLAASAAAQAHFIWLVPGGTPGKPTVEVRFGEDASADDPEYLSFVKGMSLKMVTGDEAAVDVPIESTKESMSAVISEADLSLFVASHDLGVMDRGDKVFRLQYFAKFGPDVTSPIWQDTKSSDDIKLDIIPSMTDGKITLTALFDGQPAAGAQVIVMRPESDDIEAETNDQGQVTFDPAGVGTYSARVRHIDAQPGEHKGKQYPETRYYCTIALAVNSVESPAAVSGLQNLPQPVTSFGAAVSGEGLYVYGGHCGDPHSYSTLEQSNQLSRLDLKSGEWKTLIDGPHLQGLALVTHADRLYRLGGFTAKNKEGEDHDLWSQDCAAAFDPASGKWTELPALPEPRSSHDAAVVGDTIYVVGGWAMAGEGDSTWHTTAWALDLTQETLNWTAVPAPPFQRRALATAAHNGKLYVIGGMQQKGGPTTRTAIFDPASGAWSEGPALQTPPGDDGDSGFGRNMTGFGVSSFATGGRLYASTFDGSLQRLTEDGAAWETISQTPTARFFHRLLPLDSERLVVVGGASMEEGKFEEVEVLKVN